MALAPHARQPNVCYWLQSKSLERDCFWVAQIDRDPVVSNRLVDPALEVTVADVEKMIALKRPAHRYPVTHKNAEDLAADVLIRGSVKHGLPMFERRAL